jgi:hypothetical protein
VITCSFQADFYDAANVNDVSGHALVVNRLRAGQVVVE